MIITPQIYYNFAIQPKIFTIIRNFLFNLNCHVLGIPQGDACVAKRSTQIPCGFIIAALAAVIQ